MIDQERSLLEKLLIVNILIERLGLRASSINMIIIGDIGQIFLSFEMQT